MPLNTDRIQTTHVGSLPRTPELLKANNRFQAGEIDLSQLGEALDEGVFRANVAQARDVDAVEQSLLALENLDKDPVHCLDGDFHLLVAGHGETQTEEANIFRPFMSHAWLGIEEIARADEDL